jgi:hypothetical protein
VSALFSPLLLNFKFLFCSDAPLRDIPSIPVFSPPPSRHIPYLPSDPLSYAPPYPILPYDPVTSISCYSCCTHLDHFRIEYTSSPVRINSLVQDDNWDGPLLVLRWVAANSLEIVGECEGRDFEGQRIVRFLIFMHFRVRRPEDLILIEGMWRLRQYPHAPDSAVLLYPGIRTEIIIYFGALNRSCESFSYYVYGPSLCLRNITMPTYSHVHMFTYSRSFISDSGN